jgi:hypothetical protein
MKQTRKNRSIKKHRQKAIPNRLAPGSARGQNMKNKPNFTPNGDEKYAKRTQFQPQRLLSNLEKYAKRTQFYPQFFILSCNYLPAKGALLLKKRKKRTPFAIL